MYTKNMAMHSISQNICSLPSLSFVVLNAKTETEKAVMQKDRKKRKRKERCSFMLIKLKSLLNFFLLLKLYRQLNAPLHSD